MSPTTLDSLIPRWDFAESHERTLSGEPAAAYDAFRVLRLDEMPITRVLFFVRTLPERVLGRGLQLPIGADAPLLDLMIDSGFLLLVDTPPDELVLGLIVQLTGEAGSEIADPGAFSTYDRPGAIRIAMDVRFVPSPNGRTHLMTTTRVAATSDRARRLFGPYWLPIRPFSGLIRREWMLAVDRRLRRAPAS